MVNLLNNLEGHMVKFYLLDTGVIMKSYKFMHISLFTITFSAQNGAKLINNHLVLDSRRRN